MKKNGFTLIELLGVITILSLLVVLVFPRIINSVRNSSKDTDDLTKEMIYKASDLYISNHGGFAKINGAKFIIQLQDLIDAGLLVSPIKLSDNEDITNDKCIQVVYDNAYKYELKNSGECLADLKCALTDNDNDGEPSLSDVVTCGTESFYVMTTDETADTVTMLSMYNLNVGAHSYPNEVTYGIQDEHATLQDDNTRFGDVIFSSSIYWGSSKGYVYNENSDLYQYVSAYETYLKDSRVSSASATIMSFEHLENLGCINNDSIPGATCPTSLSFLDSTSYWLGYVDEYPELVDSTTGYYNYIGIIAVDSEGPGVSLYDNYDCFGVRPVVTISTFNLNY